MLTINNLNKSFGSKKAVDNVTIHIAPGEVYGSIGHNGAGKTTTLKSVVGILQFDEGEILIDGMSIKDKPIECKKEIAKKALRLVEEGSTIILDAGSTTMELAKLLVEANIKGVTIITYALNIAYEFRHSTTYNLVMLGGQFRHGMMSFVGPYANKMLQELHADRSFIGINGYTMEDGLTTPNPYEAEVKRNIVLRSRESVLLADSQKYGKICMAKVADVAEIDALVTDSDLLEVARKEFMERGVKVY